MGENSPDRPTRPIVTETDLEGIAEEARRIAEGLGDANDAGFVELLGLPLLIERGDLHLTALLLLREHLTDDNHQELLGAASGKSKSDVQHLLAQRFPRPDLPSRIQVVPDVASQRSLSVTGGKPDAPLSKSTRKGYVPRAVRRAVFERDGQQCTFVDDSGRRCPSRAFLELDHREPRALGGTDEASNLSVKCRAHNMLSAERDFGRQHIERKKNQRKINPRQRWYGAEVALRALCAMGFKDREARRALAIVEQRGPNSQPPELETVLREALSFLA